MPAGAAGPERAPCDARSLAEAFLKPSRRPPRPDEAALLASARPVTLAGLAGHAWGDGPPVLLVHGWLGSAAQLACWAAPLVAAGFRAVAVDLPAHGSSPGERANVMIFTRAVTAVARTLGPLAGIVGHSMGGLAVAHFLLDGGAAARAVFLAPVASVTVPIGRYARHLGLSPDEEIAFRDAVNEAVGRPATEVDLRDRPALAPPSPILVLHDPADPEVPFADGQTVARWPGAVLEPTPGLGHRRILADPDVIRSGVAHLAGVRAAGALARSAP